VVLNNSTGFICNPHDPFDLADKMEKMINLPQEQRIQMGRNGRALVKRRFDITHIIEEYIGTLQQDLAD
jgi:glycosyltransferase involved in cell wall biosynthesis